MDDLYINKYRTQTFRLKSHDYASCGNYFITIITKRREHFFGRIKQGRVVLSDLGELAKQCYLEIPLQFPYIKTDEFVIMPDHMHCILNINQQAQIKNGLADADVREVGGFAGLTNPMLDDGISKAIRGYKARVSFEARKKVPSFAWHKLFYDCILPDAAALRHCRSYIQSNPEHWPSR